MGRANRLLAPRVTRDRDRLSRRRGDREPALAAKAVHHRQSGAAGGDRGRGDALSRRSMPAAPLRLLVFGGSQGARVMADIVPAAIERLAADAARRGSTIVAAGARRGPRRACATAYARLGVDGRGRAVLRRPAGAHGGERISSSSRSGASTVAELAGDRPAGDPGAAAACARPGPGAPMPACWRRPAARIVLDAGRVHARAPRRPRSRALAADAGAA